MVPSQSLHQFGAVGHVIKNDCYAGARRNSAYNRWGSIKRAQQQLSITTKIVSVKKNCCTFAQLPASMYLTFMLLLPFFLSLSQR